MKKKLFFVLCLVAGQTLAWAQGGGAGSAYDLLERLLPGQGQHFVLTEIPADQGRDLFEVESVDGKIHIRGNHGVSLASGLNWYLEEMCHCQVSLNYRQLNLPSPLPEVSTKIRKVTPFARRNFFNYCTFAYTMAWWDWPQWEQLIDYMALHGVNMPLAITGQEAVWQIVCRELGLTDEHITDFLVGPAFLPWGWMGNIDGMAGPLPQAWIDEHKILQQKILKRQRSLGMTPILQGFTGHVPPAFKDVYPDATIHQTTPWAGMPGTYFLDPQDPLFKKFGKRFIEVQTELYGTDHLYDADCFNEVNPHTNDPNYLRQVGASVYQAMTAADPEATWVFQGWFLFWQADFWKGPQVKALFSAVPEDKLLGLDLYCERHPVWKKTEAFYGMPWIWNVICNLGQKVNMSGALDVMQTNLHEACTQSNAGDLQGIGVMMEGFGYNPIVQDFILSKTWDPEPVDMVQWVEDYACRRYGTDHKQAQAAWVHLLEGPYGRNILSGSRLNYTPKLSDYDPNENAWGLDYDARFTLAACRDLLACASELKNVETYRFDLVHVCREMMINLANRFIMDLKWAYDEKDVNGFEQAATRLLGLLKDLDELCQTHECFQLGPWLKAARQWATSTEEKALYELNARAQVTMWQPSIQSHLRDYASKDWAGLYGDFYQPRWSMFVDTLRDSLAKGQPYKTADFHAAVKAFEFKWIHDRQTYPEQEVGDSVAVVRDMLAKYEGYYGLPIPQGAKLIPCPQTLNDLQGQTLVSPTIWIADESLSPLVRVLSDNLNRVTGTSASQVTERQQAGIVLQTVDDLSGEAYRLSSQSHVLKVEASTYEGFARAGATILQLVKAGEKGWTFDCVELEDKPAYPYRGVLLDVARFWNPVHTLKETVDLAFLYKYNYIHLHLSDHRYFTFPCQAYPQLRSYFQDGRRRHYTVDELKDLVSYAAQRGVVIVPEIDVPGHAARMSRQMPEAFGTQDPNTGVYRDTGYVINMANEKAYDTLDVLLGEVVEIFHTSPYVHLGADEVGHGHLKQFPEYGPYTKKHNLPLAQAGDTHELYCHFVARMNEIIKGHGKQMIAWEGFHGNGTEHARIPTDILMMAWNNSFNPPKELLKHGYTLINCSWTPLYLVPPQNYKDNQKRIYDWHPRNFEHRRMSPVVQIDKDAPLLGAQICFWEQTYEQVIPQLRSHMPAVAERVWNPESPLPFQHFQDRFQDTDQRVGTLLRPVTFLAEGLVADSQATDRFDHTLTLTMHSDISGVIRYRIDSDWGQFPDGNSQIYDRPLVLNDSQVVTAALFDHQGQRISPYTQEGYQKVTPLYRYRVFGPVPQTRWNDMPDFTKLREMRQGVLGHCDSGRMQALNRTVLAKFPPFGHIDTQPKDLFNPFAMELNGQIRIPRTGTYQFRVSCPHGMARVRLDGVCVAGSQRPNQRDALTAGKLEAGVYTLQIHYFYNQIVNHMNIQVQAPDQETPMSLDELMIPMDTWLAPDQLTRMSTKSDFQDPERAAYLSLATDKPVTCSGGTQEPHVPANIVDADPSNRSGWHSGSHPQWIQLDLEKVETIQRIKLVTYHDGHRFYRYLIEVSENGKDYIEVVNMRENSRVSTAQGFEHHFSPRRARYVRVTMLDNSANPGVHVNELMVYHE